MKIPVSAQQRDSAVSHSSKGSGKSLAGAEADAVTGPSPPVSGDPWNVEDAETTIIPIVEHLQCPQYSCTLPT